MQLKTRKVADKNVCDSANNNNSVLNCNLHICTFVYVKTHLTIAWCRQFFVCHILHTVSLVHLTTCQDCSMYFIRLVCFLVCCKCHRNVGHFMACSNSFSQPNLVIVYIAHETPMLFSFCLK